MCNDEPSTSKKMSTFPEFLSKENIESRKVRDSLRLHLESQNISDNFCTKIESLKNLTPILKNKRTL